MGVKLSRTQLVILALFTILLAGLLAGLALREPSAPQEGAPVATSTPENVNAAPPEPLDPSFGVEINGKNAVRVSWNHLPDGTVKLLIYRTTKNNPTGWTLWKTVDVSGPSGEAGLSLAKNENASSFSYYAQATSASSTPTWTSSSTPALPPSSSPTSTPSSGGENPTPSTNTSSSPNTSSTPPSSPTSTPGGTSEPSSTSGGGGETYYDPNGVLIGTSSEPTLNFWVEHVNKNIRLNWQNLPAATNKIVISRSPNESGQWTQLVAQGNPNIVGPDFIGLVDQAITEPYYYRLEAKDQSEVLATYGPVFLPALSE